MLLWRCSGRAHLSLMLGVSPSPSLSLSLNQQPHQQTYHTPSRFPSLPSSPTRTSSRTRWSCSSCDWSILVRCCVPRSAQQRAAGRAAPGAADTAAAESAGSGLNDERCTHTHRDVFRCGRDGGGGGGGCVPISCMLCVWLVGLGQLQTMAWWHPDNPQAMLLKSGRPALNTHSHPPRVLLCVLMSACQRVG